MEDNNVPKVIIVGGGLVGSLCGCFMAERGYKVVLYEARNDIRIAKITQGRSINLALSHRGRKALKSVGLEDKILQNGIQMRGRQLHSPRGEQKFVPYDPVTNQCIYSVGRNLLNKTLLDAVEKYPNVKLHFNQKLIRSNFKEGSITLLNVQTLQTHEDKADLIIGADGAFSTLRRSMQQTPMFKYSQEYIEHGYLELSIPPERGDLMVPNRLHVWPRGQFMMIALPNNNQSWTVTLFMPFQRFEELNTKEKLLRFFGNVFPDSINLIGERDLVESFFSTKPSHLISVKCDPYHFGSKFLIIGDAAHAMVPFYGQGMNAGFEDCSILDELLNKNKDNIENTIREFSDVRVKNAQAICELAMYNYVEMRDLVTKPSYRLRKMLDDVLFKAFPKKWIPLYNSVSFSHMNYIRCIENRKWQDKVMKRAFIGFGITFVSLLYFINYIVCSSGLYTN